MVHAQNQSLRSGMKRCRNVGFQGARTFTYCRDRALVMARQGRYALQRLYSTFPGGRPGVGLLLLRSAVGLATCAEGISYLSGQSNPTSEKWLLGLVLLASGAALVAGFLTPIAGLLVALSFLGIAFSLFPEPSWGSHDARLVAFGMIIAAAALALLGPGAFSFDGRLFGRREIVIPPSLHPPES
jgi:putative oxidoreductase